MDMNSLVNQQVRVVGLDPAIKNFGIIRARIDLYTSAITVDHTRLVQTEKETAKTVRKSSDDLRRAQEIAEAVRAEIDVSGAKFVISEIPSGAQSARAAFLLGAALGIIGSLTVPIIQVSPLDTKIASVGDKAATKEQIIQWAFGLYPKLPWILCDRDSKNHKKGDLHDDNEHVADAIGVVHAGIRKPEFKQALALLRSLRAA